MECKSIQKISQVCWYFSIILTSIQDVNIHKLCGSVYLLCIEFIKLSYIILVLYCLYYVLCVIWFTSQLTLHKFRKFMRNDINWSSVHLKLKIQTCKSYSCMKFSKSIWFQSWWLIFFSLLLLRWRLHSIQSICCRSKGDKQHGRWYWEYNHPSWRNDHQRSKHEHNDVYQKRAFNDVSTVHIDAL